MNGIGIDVGSSYTKYCILENGAIKGLYSERTPVKQQEHFEIVRQRLQEKFPHLEIVSCGYGKQNASNGKKVNELTALALGGHFLSPDSDVILDIGGQDTKVIVQENGSLKKFFINDKCAAGSGWFLSNTLQMLEQNFENIDLRDMDKPSVTLTSICAVFAQSEIVQMIADNVAMDEIVNAVVWHILMQARTLLSKVVIGSNGILLSGGLTRIRGIDKFASCALNHNCVILEKSPYLSAIGCALT